MFLTPICPCCNASGCAELIGWNSHADRFYLHCTACQHEWITDDEMAARNCSLASGEDEEDSD